MNEGGSPGAVLQRSRFEGFHEGALLQERMDNAALNPFPFAMDDAHFVQSLLLTFQEVFSQERRDLLRQEGMKVDPVFYGNRNDRFGLSIVCCRVPVVYLPFPSGHRSSPVCPCPSSPLRDLRSSVVFIPWLSPAVTPHLRFITDWAISKIFSNIGLVSFPVCVFCWLGW